MEKQYFLNFLRTIDLEIIKMGQIKEIKQDELIPFAYSFLNLEYSFLTIFFVLFFSSSLLLLFYVFCIKYQKQDTKKGQSVTPEEENKYPLEESTNKQEPELMGHESRCLGNYQLKFRNFKTQKLGLTENECEDQFSLSPDNSPTIRIAIADGATESLFSDLWADIIVNTYSKNGEELFQLSGLQDAYKNFIEKANQKISDSPDTRQWFLYEKLEKGSHVTFAGLEFINAEKVKISTVGDSCIFWHDSKTNKISMLPKLSPEDFGSFPFSICHLPETWKRLEEKIVKEEFFLKETSQIILCTDALANWLSQELQNNPSAWKTLFEISDPNSFVEFVNHKRNQKEMRNDDVTLVLIDVLSLNV